MIEERRKEPRNYIDKLKKEMNNPVTIWDYSALGLERLCKLLRLEEKADRVLDKTHE